MSATFENLFGLQFCQYKCGVYIGFSDSELSADHKSHKPLDAKTGEIHECPKEGWSKQKQCVQCNEKIIFHNSHVKDGKKIRFDSPGVRHSCTRQSEDFVENESIADKNFMIRKNTADINSTVRDGTADSNSSVQETAGRWKGGYYGEGTLEKSK
jgi:hypothetical protein